jgi:Tfp pilus assembly protein PilZ
VEISTSKGGQVVLVEGSAELQRRAAEAAKAALVELSRAHLDAVERAGLTHPLAMLFDLADPATKDSVLRVRSHAELAGVPILGFARFPDEVMFQEIFWWGMDDLVSSASTHGLTERLRALASRATPPSERSGGLVIIEGADRGFRVQMARVFANTRHAVRFAVDEGEALKEAAAPGVALVVSAAPHDAHAALTVLSARSQGIEVPWLVGMAPRDETTLRRRLHGVEHTGVFDMYAPPENALFLANELRRPSGVESRRAARVLYSAVVRFRVAGSDEDELALTYNVSTSGIYVRTLATLPAGAEVWLELRPPRSERTVRLHAKVAWARPFGQSHSAVMPPGMGLALMGEGPDRELYQRGVRTYAEAHGYSHEDAPFRREDAR